MSQRSIDVNVVENEKARMLRSIHRMDCRYKVMDGIVTLETFLDQNKVISFTDIYYSLFRYIAMHSSYTDSAHNIQSCTNKNRDLK